jgi:hypothetical protein
MKTTQHFDRVESATIIVNQNHIDTYRDILKKRRITIKEEKFNDTENITVFLVENLSINDLFMFDENDAETCYVHYCVLRRGKVRAQVYTADTARQHKYVSEVVVGYFEDGDDGSFRKVADVYAQREIMAEKPKGYGLNWGGWGTMNIQTSRKFADGIQLALGIAEDCTKQFC